MNVVALIPAHDEEASIGETVSAVLALPAVDAVLVVDDGSTDDTASLAAAAGATVLRLERNAGKGAAMEAGLEAARDADVVVLLDADLGGSASGAAALLAPVTAGEADMTIAVLPKPPGSGGFGLVKGLARSGIRAMGGGFEAQAPLSGQRALTRRAVDAVRPMAYGYGVEVALTVRALRAGCRVLEVPVPMTHRATGKDAAGFAHRGRQFAHVLRALAMLSREGR